MAPVDPEFIICKAFGVRGPAAISFKSRHLGVGPIAQW